jgi:xanthine dehydrogenase accessory factor
MTEIERPVAVRRSVAFCEAVYSGSAKVEGVTALLVVDRRSLEDVWRQSRLGVLVDPEWRIVADLRPDILIDAIMAKRNLGTNKEEAPLVIAVGPGFAAPGDVHAVVESNRGHNLGRVILSGAAAPHTSVPGSVAGFATERVLRAPCEGVVRHRTSIGDVVKKGDVVLCVDDAPVRASIDGIVRGLIQEIPVSKGRKLGDIDPRDDVSLCNSISDKARAIAGGVLEVAVGWALRAKPTRFERPCLFCL